MCMATMHPAGGLTTGTVFGRRKKNMKSHDSSCQQMEGQPRCKTSVDLFRTQVECS